MCEAIGIPPVLHMGSCVANTRILTVLTQMVEEGALGDDIDQIPAVGLAPEWTSEKALAIATYCVASGAYVIFGGSSPVSGMPDRVSDSDIVLRYLSEGWEKLYGGKLEFRELDARRDACLGQSLTTAYGITHGQAIGAMLPHVVRFNGEAVDGMYMELIAASNGTLDFLHSNPSVAGLADYLTILATEAGLAARLRELGVKESRLPALAASAAKQWTAGLTRGQSARPNFWRSTRRHFDKMNTRPAYCRS